MMNAQNTQTIHGYVQALPQGLTSREEMARVAVLTDDGLEYRVLHKGPGTSLLKNINAHVEVTGYVTAVAEPEADPEPGPEPQAHYIIEVKSYRLTDGFDDPWYDDAVRQR